MDPNANLEEQRRIIARWLDKPQPEETVADREADMNRLMDLAEALDGWLSRGGFLPEAWQKGQSRRGQLGEENGVF